MRNPSTLQVAEHVLPVAVDDVKTHPRYKYFKDSGEEEYNSFLGVPLIDRGILQGVLIVQTNLASFTEADEALTMSAAAIDVSMGASKCTTNGPARLLEAWSELFG